MDVCFTSILKGSLNTNNSEVRGYIPLVFTSLPGPIVEENITRVIYNGKYKRLYHLSDPGIEYRLSTTY